jgi:hypothetical protein
MTFAKVTFSLLLVIYVDIKLVHEKKFPQENIAFTLWCDLVKWYGLKDTRGMRDSTDTLKTFLGLGHIIRWTFKRC